MKPITPAEVKNKKIDSIQPEMIQAANELIVKKFNGHSASIKKNDLIERYCKIKGVSNTEKLRGTLYEDHQLDIEGIFRQAGWSVNFESPSYGDSNFDDYYEFKLKK